MFLICLVLFVLVSSFLGRRRWFVGCCAAPLQLRAVSNPPQRGKRRRQTKGGRKQNKTQQTPHRYGVDTSAHAACVFGGVCVMCVRVVCACRRWHGSSEWPREQKQTEKNDENNPTETTQTTQQNNTTHDTQRSMSMCVYMRVCLTCVPVCVVDGVFRLVVSFLWLIW